MRTLFPMAACAALLAACGQPQTDTADEVTDATPAASGADGTDFASDDERTFYTLGIALGENIAVFDLTEREMDLVQMGMSDTLRDGPYRVEPAEFEARIQVLATERTRAAAVRFGEQVASEPGAERTASGLIYIPIEEGDGDSPEPTDTVRVHYHGTLRDGSVFDSSVERGVPAEFPLNGVIPCWTEGVPMMNVGGKAKLFCPSDTAYGDRGTQGIPGGTALLFEIELIDIIEPETGEEAEAATDAEAAGE